MNMKSIIGSVCVAGAICGAYYSGVKSGQSDSIHAENLTLHEENINLKSKLNGLERDLFEAKKEKIQTIFPLQMDSLKRISVGKRAPEFLERVVNNASFLDSINGNDRSLYKVVEQMSSNEIEDIYLSSRYGSKAAHNLIDFFENSFKKIKIKP